MPLKHLTETLLVLLLSVVVIVTGILLPTLPPLPLGILPWGIVFVLTLVYPIALYPFLKSNRADYSFRLLQFLPAALTLIWFCLSLTAEQFPAVQVLSETFTWGWTFFGVALSFLLILVFCLHVIRRRSSRISILAGLFVPFLLLALLSEGLHGTPRLTAFLWQGSWWDITGSGSLGGSGKDLAYSPHPAEEEWRRKIREMEESEAQSSSGSSISMSSIHVSPPIAFQGSSSSRPKRLPSAGFGWDAVIVAMLGIYTGVLHNRAKKRMRA
jgi:hypothetical protein